MLLKKIFLKNSNKQEIKGIIGYLGLEDFWLSCSQNEQKDLTRYYQGGLGTSANASPIQGNIQSSSNTELKYLSAMIGWAVSEKNYSLADKIINTGNKIKISKNNILDAHYFWQEAAECYYKQRNDKQDAIDMAINFCIKDIEMFPQYSYIMKQEFGSIPRINTFQRLAIIYEKNKQYKEAIQICELAIKYELIDSTKGGYIARLEKLKKKL